MLQSNRTALALALVSAALGVTGCQSQDLPIGDDTSALLVGATWEGYIEQIQFRSGTDVMRINVSSVMGSTVTGTVRFGTGPDLPAPTSALVGYPTGPDDIHSGYEIRLPFEGHDFTMEDTQLTGHRLRFTISPLTVWQHWCELQTSHVYGSNGMDYLCATNGYSVSGNMCSQNGMPADCGHVHLCQDTPVCTCDAAGCKGSAGEKLDFDIDFDAQDANGSVIGIAGLPFQAYQPRPTAAFNVRLTRN